MADTVEAVIAATEEQPRNEPDYDGGNKFQDAISAWRGMNYYCVGSRRY